MMESEEKLAVTIDLLKKTVDMLTKVVDRLTDLEKEVEKIKNIKHE